MVDFTNPETPRSSGSIPGESSSSVTTIATGIAAPDSGRGDPRARYEPTTYEIAGGAFSLVLWTFVFAVGIVFPSEPYRNALNGQGATLSNAMVLPYLCLFLLTYTPSNVAILCCISAWLGELGLRTRIDGSTSVGLFQRGDYIAAIMRGFLAYLAILTGFVVIGSGVNVFVAPTPEGYVRLAAIVSLVGFLSGFNPALFRSFASTISGRVITQRSPNGAATQIVEGASPLPPLVIKSEATTPTSSRINQVTL
ncbi:hypothetical protein SAMN05444166_3281 [Singulisphaera sp. GP187]|uniref:hypothetical protein n=1 Tax=Singulisphaera sp. GP187 TaxID=1882752 RepID=UPI00092AEEC0|nr:hypothetical protein [Singulisphaera sp. GP187]SIO25661.1 hypothetical protein SAMN05444166_3281 [Singulisphaera sp. GP187]